MLLPDLVVLMLLTVCLVHLLIPMIVLSGQSKRETLVVNSGLDNLRQLGDESRILFIWFQKYLRLHILYKFLLRSLLLSILFLLDQFRTAWTGLVRYSDRCSRIHPSDYFDNLVNKPLQSSSSSPKASESDLEAIATHLLSNNRPVLYVGSGIRTANAYAEF